MKIYFFVLPLTRELFQQANLFDKYLPSEVKDARGNLDIRLLVENDTPTQRERTKIFPVCTPLLRKKTMKNLESNGKGKEITIL